MKMHQHRYSDRKSQRKSAAHGKVRATRLCEDGGDRPVHSAPLDDFTDEQLTTVLKRLIRKEGLRAEPSSIQLAVSSVSQRRRLDNFGNAGEVVQILDRAKVKLAGRGHVAAAASRRRDKALLEAAAARRR